MCYSFNMLTEYDESYCLMSLVDFYCWPVIFLAFRSCLQSLRPSSWPDRNRDLMNFRKDLLPISEPTACVIGLNGTTVDVLLRESLVCFCCFEFHVFDPPGHPWNGFTGLRSRQQSVRVEAVSCKARARNRGGDAFGKSWAGDRYPSARRRVHSPGAVRFPAQAARSRVLSVVGCLSAGTGGYRASADIS